MESKQQLSFSPMLEQEWKACAALAAKAFFTYEYFSAFVPDEKRRKRFLGSMMESEFLANRSKAEFYTAKLGDDLVGVAMLCSPGYRKPSDMEYMKAGFGKVFLHGGIKSVSAWNEMEAKASTPCREFGNGNWYLNLLTISPECQGLGIGSRMLHELLLPRVKAGGGSGLCLFTNSEINREFYRKNELSEFHSQSFVHQGKTIGSWSYQIHID